MNLRTRLALIAIFTLGPVVTPDDSVSIGESAFVGCSSWTTGKTLTTIDMVQRNGRCIAENFDLGWLEVVARCGITKENEEEARQLWTASRMTAFRAGAQIPGMTAPAADAGAKDASAK